MIIECPRCGFAQPKDRYCANCGLDIDHFKPTPEPRLKALAQNTFLQITLVVIVVAALASGIYTAQKKAVQSQLEEAKRYEATNPNSAPAPAPLTRAALAPPPPPPPASAPSEPASASRTAKPRTSTVPSADAAAEVEKENQILQQEQQVQPEGESAPPGGNIAATTAVAPKSLSIYFLEMPRLAIDQIAAENQILNEYGGTRSILINSQPGPNTLGSHVILPGGGSRRLEDGKKVEIFFGNSQDPMMSFEIGHTFHSEQEFEIEVVEQSTMAPTFNGKYTIPKNATLMIVGMVPQQQISAEQQAAFSRTPLAILASPQFQNTQTQFVMLIQPK